MLLSTKKKVQLIQKNYISKVSHKLFIYLNRTCVTNLLSEGHLGCVFLFEYWLWVLL